MNSKQTAAVVAAGAALLYVFSKGMKKAESTTTAKSYPNSTERSRGYRNNNPLNIRISSTNWAGMIPTAQNGDGSFVQFTTMPYGFRAALRNIRTYIVRDGKKTIQEIINKWAPPSENNTSKYVTDVCTLTGMLPGTVVSQTNQQQLSSLVRAMAFIENGYYCNNIDSYINQGWNLYINSI